MCDYRVEDDIKDFTDLNKMNKGWNGLDKSEWMNEWMNEWTRECTKELTNKRTKELKNEWINGLSELYSAD